MTRRTADYGVAHWLRLAEWFRARPFLLHRAAADAAADIRAEFGVSRATAYRWLAAWRDVHPVIDRAHTTTGGEP